MTSDSLQSFVRRVVGFPFWVLAVAFQVVAHFLDPKGTVTLHD